jgi:anti-sigma B factor antagonist
MALSIELEPDARPATVMLRLRGSATYHEAPELRRALFEAIGRAQDKNLVVELEKVERMDTAALAVLVEGLMATRDGDPAVFLMHPSESVRRVFRLAGLEDALTRCFDCWEDVAAAIAV